jgi:hypothetical protein
MAILFNKEVGLYRYSTASNVALNAVLMDYDLGEMTAESANEVFSMHVQSIGTGGTLQVLFSDYDGTNYVSVVGENAGSSVVSANVTGPGLYNFPILGRFVRVVMSAATTAGSTAFAATTLPGQAYRGMAITNTVPVYTAANAGAVDVGSAAITTSSASANINHGWGCSYQVNYRVTAVSGTSPTLDVSIEESTDNGATWNKVYDFPRITAAGSYNSPTLPVRGTMYRVQQTVGGTTPSFTREIRRIASHVQANPLVQMFDRSIAINTLNSVTPTLDTRECGNQLKVSFNTGAGATTAPQLQLEGSDDGGLSWNAIGAPLVAVAGTTVVQAATGQSWAQVRGRISTAGVAATAGYVFIRAHD